jgi:hypothetical protein
MASGDTVDTVSGALAPSVQDNQDDQQHNRSEENEELEDTLAEGERPSHENSPAVQHKRKHRDLETSSSSDCEANHGYEKAQKINGKAGRPRAGDYDDLAKELILQAATVYRCLLSTEDAFPDLAAEAEMVKTAWGQVNNEIGLTPLRLTPDIAKIVSDHLLFRSYINRNLDQGSWIASAW